MIAAVDEFILYDEVQYTRRDWRNRNRIKTPFGTQWLTVPVKTKEKYLGRICDIQIDGTGWARAHWRTLEVNYRRAPFFDEIARWLKPIYLEESFTHLSHLNRRLIRLICDFLKIQTKISNSAYYHKGEDGQSRRLAEICVRANADEYISGPAARKYISEDAFSNLGINLTWFNYDGYPEYPQLWGEFEHRLSVLDLLFNCGADSKYFVRKI